MKKKDIKADFTVEELDDRLESIALSGAVQHAYLRQDDSGGCSASEHPVHHGGGGSSPSMHDSGCSDFSSACCDSGDGCAEGHGLSEGCADVGGCGFHSSMSPGIEDKIPE